MGRFSEEITPMKQHHNVGNLKFEGNFMVLTIDGEEKRFPLDKISPPLYRASDQQRNTFEISPSGYGIHWPLIDEDISIDGLLGIAHAPEWRQKSA
jgi:hypothetical protein